MKIIKIATVVIAVLVSTTVYGKPLDMALVKGKINLSDLPADISLYAVEDGETVMHSTVQVERDGSFGFYFTPAYSGIYTIGNKNKSYRIYISPGKQLSVSIADNGLTVLSKDPENKKLEEWNKVIGELKDANMLGSRATYVTIFPKLSGIEKQKNDFIANIHSADKPFDQLLKGLANAEFEYELYHFLFMPRAAHPSAEEYPEVYKRLSVNPHFTNTSILNYDFGRRFMGVYLTYEYATGPKGADAKGMAQLCIQHIKNDTLKGWYLLDNDLLRARTYDEAYVDKLEEYKPYILTESQIKKLTEYERTIRTLSEGVKSVNFEGNTTEDKKVSLNDLKGKLVLVDVWATWCGPCKAEIPALKQLEEDMKGKNIAFVSYSIDAKKDLDKWKKMIADDNMGGIQLIGPDAWKSPVCIDYNIKGIPRFMLFDTDGKIISIDAPRPSGPELKKLINKKLK